uniref:Uncharacterized protein n=1 Tax=Picea glauca TaxID=3330 RepID=A0A117NIY9_PICGL|nr:hypothetical protein ABT39_MTgene507 [Picea glauca]QHR89441.1 hypothetical protein Q903MT_gene3462 [Picea sitchensis]
MLHGTIYAWKLVGVNGGAWEFLYWDQWMKLLEQLQLLSQPDQPPTNATIPLLLIS